MGDFYAHCLDMLEMEKKSIMGLTENLLEMFDAPVYRSKQERMQLFLCSIYESCFQILGNMGPSLLQDIYSIPDLEPHLVNFIFSGLSNMPDFRLRAMLRLFVKPFLLSCPPEKYGSVASPILVPLLTFLHQKLAQKWLTSREEDYSEMNSECSEILELELVRLLTRDLVDLIYACCITRKTPDRSAPKAEGEGARSAAEAEGISDIRLAPRLTDLLSPGPPSFSCCQFETLPSTSLQRPSASSLLPCCILFITTSFYKFGLNSLFSCLQLSRAGNFVCVLICLLCQLDFCSLSSSPC